MKTIMKEPKTEYRHKIDNKTSEEFVKDFSFKVLPCIAGRPQTKAKVESPMKILDEMLEKLCINISTNLCIFLLDIYKTEIYNLIK